MSVGPFVGIKPVYTLTFSPSSDPTAPPEYDEYGDPVPVAAGEPFSIGAHLRLFTVDEKEGLGYDRTEMALEVFAADPMESDPRIQHKSVATITPDFMGLKGTLRIQGRPLSRLEPVVDAIGVKLAAVFNG